MLLELEAPVQIAGDIHGQFQVKKSDVKKKFQIIHTHLTKGAIWY